MSILDEPVLVLNKSWNPIETCNVRDAFAKVFGEKARIINHEDCSLHDFLSWASLSPDGFHTIQTAYMQIRCPEIIVLDSEGGKRRNIIAYSRRNILKRDGMTCQYCGCQPGTKELTIDHVTPKHQGGKGGWLNCVAACWDCNSVKKNKTPEQAGMKLRTRPHQPSWSPIFQVSRTKYKDSWKQFLPEKLMN